MAHRILAPIVALLIAVTPTACGGGDTTDPTDDAAPRSTTVAPGGDGDVHGGTVRPTEPPDPETEPTGAETEPPGIEGVVVGTLEEPIMMLPRPGDDRLWLAERPGRIRTATIAEDGTLRIDEEPALDLTADTVAQGEQGLLGLAFSPDGTILHASYTNRDGDTRVDSWDVDDTVQVDSRRTIFELEQPFPNHNGGHLLLTPDGSLLLGLGDGGSADDPGNRAQDDGSLLGKLLRLDPDGGEPEVLAKGLRNPWRFDADEDGSLWIADVGQNEWEEINHVPADGFPGADFGWSGHEGTHLHLDDPARISDGWIPPVHEYDHQEGRCSVTGGIVYRGAALLHLDGRFLYADLCQGRIHAVSEVDGHADVLDLGVEVPRPFSFGRDAAGEPYVLSADGDIIALRPVT